MARRAFHAAYSVSLLVLGYMAAINDTHHAERVSEDAPGRRRVHAARLARQSEVQRSRIADVDVYFESAWERGRATEYATVFGRNGESD